MRKVVVTGLGIVSSIGNNTNEVLKSLKEGKSGISENEQMIENGFRSQIAGAIKIDPKEHIDKRTLRFMGDGAAYAYLALEQAIEDAKLEPNHISNQELVLLQVRVVLLQEPCLMHIKQF